MTAPARTVGTRINSRMCVSTCAMLAASAAFSARIFMANATAPDPRNGSIGGGAWASMAARMAASLPPDARIVSAAAIAALYQTPGL